MRKFFSFKSQAASSTGNKISPSLDPPDVNNKNVYWEKPPGKKGCRDVSRDSYLRSHCPEVEDSHSSLHRRSMSFSSPAVYTDFEEGGLNSLADQSRSPSVCGSRCHSPSPGRHMRISKADVGITRRQSPAIENINSPTSSTIHQSSSENSAYSSPVPLRCRAARVHLNADSNRTLDLYIDGENQDIKPSEDYQKHFYHCGTSGHSDEAKALSYLRRPPRALSTAPSSPTYKENPDRYFFREAEDTRQHLCIPDRASNSVRPASPVYHKKKKLEKVLHPFHGRPSQEYDSETTTSVEDIYEDSSNPVPTSNPTSTSQQNISDFSTTENVYRYCDAEPFPCERQDYIPENGSEGSNKLSVSELQKQCTDEELTKKVKDAERMLTILADEDHELANLATSSLNASALLQIIRNIAEDRRYLAHEISSQIKCRIAERSSTREKLRHTKFELDTRTMRLEKEKNELQSSLETELDRRSSDWSLRLEKFQYEEQRLRERVRELAEQNVSLQREISAVKGNEADNRSKIMNSQMELNDLTASLEEARTENHNLKQTGTELQERLNCAEEDRNYIHQSLEEKEKENKELRRAVVQFQRMYSEQDKTINGLRQGYSNEIGKQFTERDDKFIMLQMEQIRLTGVEQILRKELESYRNELESLRHENLSLLDRLQGNKNGSGFSSIKLDQELSDRVDCLQSQGLSLLNKHSQLFGKILNLIKPKKHAGIQEDKRDSDGYSIGDYIAKYQNLRRGIENFRRSLLTIQEILGKKSNLEELEQHCQSTQGGSPRQSKVPSSEADLQVELKAETLLTRVLREKLCSKELEGEQLQSDLSSSILAREIMQTERQRLQDELSCLTYKTKDMELQIIKKDDNTKQLQHDLQECRKELTSTRGVLMNVSEERNHMWEEVKHSKETIMLLKLEVSSLKKKIESLDEHVLIKEGEIAILKDSLFDTTYNPKSVEDFSIE